MGCLATIVGCMVFLGLAAGVFVLFGPYIVTPKLIYSENRNKLLDSFSEGNVAIDVRTLFGPDVKMVCFYGAYSETARDVHGAYWSDSDGVWTLLIETNDGEIDVQPVLQKDTDATVLGCLGPDAVLKLVTRRPGGDFNRLVYSEALDTDALFRFRERLPRPIDTTPDWCGKVDKEDPKRRPSCWSADDHYMQLGQ